MSRWPKFNAHCVVCRKLRIVQPLYPTTLALRQREAKVYICSDCTKAATPKQIEASRKVEQEVEDYAESVGC